MVIETRELPGGEDLMKPVSTVLASGCEKIAVSVGKSATATARTCAIARDGESCVIALSCNGTDLQHECEVDTGIRLHFPAMRLQHSASLRESSTPGSRQSISAVQNKENRTVMVKIKRRRIDSSIGLPQAAAKMFSCAVRRFAAYS
jgi:hypothetical protein